MRSGRTTGSKMAEYNIIYGPPGTGKTTRLLEIIDFEMVEMNVPSDKIAFVTFTRKGANEGINRAAGKFNLPPEAFPYFKTLHSFAHSFNKKKIMRVRDMFDFASKTGISIDANSNNCGEDQIYMDYIELYRNNRNAAAKILPELDGDKALWIMRQYRNYKDTFSVVDFTDIIENYEGPAPVDVAIIDEAQDLTTLQWQMVHKAFSHCKRVYIAGDDDQAIFEWSGADVNAFLSLKGHTETLSKSYRLPDNLVHYARHITDNIHNRIDKEYSGNGTKGIIEVVNKPSEIYLDRNEEYLLLSRNKYQQKWYTEWLDKLCVPYLINGELVYNDKDLKAITEWTRLQRQGSMTKHDVYMFSRILKGDADLSKPWYEVFDWTDDKILYMRDRLSHKQVMQPPKINISTIHQVKGGEADNVVILSDMSKKCKVQFDIMPDAEHRVFYVGATRARKTLTLVKPMSRTSYNCLC